jgi:hypothetical protein
MPVSWALAAAGALAGFLRTRLPKRASDCCFQLISGIAVLTGAPAYDDRFLLFGLITLAVVP